MDYDFMSSNDDGIIIVVVGVVVIIIIIKLLCKAFCMHLILSTVLHQLLLDDMH